jgi:hypothetical protein
MFNSEGPELLEEISLHFAAILKYCLSHICGCWKILCAYKLILMKTCHRLIPESAEKDKD